MGKLNVGALLLVTLIGLIELARAKNGQYTFFGDGTVRPSLRKRIGEPPAPDSTPAPTGGMEAMKHELGKHKLGMFKKIIQESGTCVLTIFDAIEAMPDECKPEVPENCNVFSSESRSSLQRGSIRANFSEVSARLQENLKLILVESKTCVGYLMAEDEDGFRRHKCCTLVPEYRWLCDEPNVWYESGQQDY